MMTRVLPNTKLSKDQKDFIFKVKQQSENNTKEKPNVRKDYFKLSGKPVRYNKQTRPKTAVL